jgi:hypothetical protein
LRVIEKKKKKEQKTLLDSTIKQNTIVETTRKENP